MFASSVLSTAYYVGVQWRYIVLQFIYTETKKDTIQHELGVLCNDVDFQWVYRTLGYINHPRQNDEAPGLIPSILYICFRVFSLQYKLGNLVYRKSYIIIRKQIDYCSLLWGETKIKSQSHLNNVVFVSFSSETPIRKQFYEVKSLPYFVGFYSSLLYKCNVDFSTFLNVFFTRVLFVMRAFRLFG